MGETDDEGGASDDETGKRQLRLLGVGFVLAGGLTYLLAGAANPRELLVLLLGLLGLGALVLERTQRAIAGISIGLLTGGIGVWLWPFLQTGELGYRYVGGLMVAVGLVNVLLAPVGLYFRRLGKRLAGEE